MPIPIIVGLLLMRNTSNEPKTFVERLATSIVMILDL